MLQKKGLGLLLLATAFSCTAGAQGRHTWEHRDPHFVEPRGFSLGCNLGIADMWSDVGTEGIIDHYNNAEYRGSIKPMGGLYIRYTHVSALSVRLGMNYGVLYASDKFNEEKAKEADNFEDDAVQRFTRNLNARTQIAEGSLIFEISPLRFNVESGIARRRFQPYALIGIAGYWYNAKGEYRSRSTGGATKWLSLNDLNLEGNGWAGTGAPAKDKQWQMAIPMGLGVKWDIGEQLGLGIEYVYRYCFTDYLDGVSNKYINPVFYDLNMNPQDAAIARDFADKSWEVLPGYDRKPGDQRGNPDVNDSYSTVQITFFWRVFNKHKIWW